MAKPTNVQLPVVLAVLTKLGENAPDGSPLSLVKAETGFTITQTQNLLMSLVRQGLVTRKRIPSTIRSVLWVYAINPNPEKPKPKPRVKGIKPIGRPKGRKSEPNARRKAIVADLAAPDAPGDNVLASKYKVTRQYIESIRRILGIKAYFPRLKERIKLLHEQGKDAATIAKETEAKLKTVNAQLGLKQESELRAEAKEALIERIKAEGLLGKLSDPRVGEVYGLTGGQVQRIREKLGLLPAAYSPRTKGFVPIDRDLLRGLWATNTRAEDVAAALTARRIEQSGGLIEKVVSVGQVYAIVSRLGIPPRKHGNPGKPGKPGKRK